MLTPYVGTVYAFDFITPFEDLNGIYRVDQIVSYDDVVESGVDISQLYISRGISEEEFTQKYLPELRIDKILKLTSVEKKNVIHIPTTLGKNEPDPNVKQYAKLALAITLGVYGNIEQVEFVKNTMESIITKGLGIDNSAHIFTTSDVWMTEEDYAQQETLRVQKKEKLVNLYSEVTRLRKELDSANTKIAYYEDLIIKLNTSA